MLRFLLLPWLAALPLSAQASFFEGFDGQTVANLQGSGWSFRNQSAPVGQLGWRPTDVIDAYEGTHYLVTDGYSVPAGGVGSNWAVLPAVAGQVAGDELSFHIAEGWTALRSDVMEMRYSATGGDDTGSSATDLGDFDTLLASYAHDTIGGWSPRTITLPGSGRIAFRFWVPTGRAAGMYVDSVTVGVAPIGAVPFPGAGETVHWTTAMSPVQLAAGTSQILSGGTVIVDPGVRVDLPDAAELVVEGALDFLEGSEFHGGINANVSAARGGSLRFLGSPSAPVIIRADSGYTTGGVRAWSSSRLTMEYVDIDALGWVASGSIATVEHATFTSASTRLFQASGFRTYNGTLAVRNSSFLDSVILEEGGYLLLDDNEFRNTVLTLQRTASPQTLYLDGITATDVSDGAPFEIHRFDVLFGPNNIIANNLYPVRLETGGIAPGSMLPTSGNVNDYVSGRARFGSRSTWSKVGLPYVLDWDNDIDPLSGNLKIEPGVLARFRRGQFTTSDAFSISGLANLDARGTPEEPIVLTGNGAGWGGLFFGDNDSKRPRLQHTWISEADTGVIAKASTVSLGDCLLYSNGTGAQSNSAGRVVARGSTFLGNGTGVETSPGAGGSSISAGRADLDGRVDPNRFEGNGQGVRVQNAAINVDARGNWWGAPTGPTHASNPGGSGDSVVGTAQFSPFLTAEPATDSAPLVRVQRVGDILQAGTRMILRWDIRDAGQIVSQRLEYSPHGSNPPLAPLIDGIAGDVRTIEFVVPVSPPSSNLALPVLRVVAVDDRGQAGWDEVRFFTPYQDDVTFDVDPMPAVVRPGERHGVCFTQNYADAYLVLDDIDWAFSIGGTTTNCLSGDVTIPSVSTDLARIAVAHPLGAGGRIRYEYSDYFSIRPDPAIGDSPPVIQLLAPIAQTFSGGSTVPFRWSAADDEALRSFTVQASYDEGRSWNVLAEDLGSNLRSWDWLLPPSEGIGRVLVRVVATDLRFQTSSAASELRIVRSRRALPALPPLAGGGIQVP